MGSVRPRPVDRRRSSPRPSRPPLFGTDDRALSAQPVVISTTDKKTWDGMIYRPQHPTGGRRRMAVLIVHGSVGNYVSGLPRRLSFGIASAGFTVLAVNTRMANYGVFFGGGLLHRTPLDIDAALALLGRIGFRQVVLVGFSMGATIATHYQALRRPAQVVGLATVAHPASLPGATRRRWQQFNSWPTYEDVALRARVALRPDPEKSPNDRIVVVRRASGPSDRPRDAEIWTLKTFWFARGPEAYHAVSRLRVGQVTVPMAIIQAGADELVPSSEGQELATIAERGACPGVWLEEIDGANHVFSGYEDPVADALVAWIDRLRRGL